MGATQALEPLWSQRSAKAPQVGICLQFCLHLYGNSRKGGLPILLLASGAKSGFCLVVLKKTG